MDLNRDDALAAAEEPNEIWDVVVIGGGASGLGAAVEAASRGYRTLLLEQHDFAKGTSSRSTKLIHGGVRYLRQGNVALVFESLRERGRLLRNAPHLCRPLSFIVPTYDRWQAFYYGTGLKIYDLLAGRFSLGPSRRLSRAEVRGELPTLEPAGLRGGVRYFDAQFDDARLAVCLVQTLFDLEGVALNYARVIRLLKEAGRIRGAVARDLESGREFEVRARGVINATGVFADAVRRLDEPDAHTVVTASQGAHVVLDRQFLPGTSALMVPKTADGRVLFAIPWHGHVVVGTTDTPISKSVLEPRPLGEEIEFLLDHTARYLTKDPAASDVLSAFAGLRPLVGSEGATETARLSRDHTVLVSASGLVTLTGGKWTTYRRMGQDAVDQAVAVASLEPRLSRTREHRLHGWVDSAAASSNGPAEFGKFPPHWELHGADAPELAALAGENPDWSAPLHPRLPYRAVDVIWAVRQEMARSVEDVLARRTRALMLDARAAIELAPEVAALVATELGRDNAWRDAQVAAFSELARGYLI